MKIKRIQLEKKGLIKRLARMNGATMSEFIVNTMVEIMEQKYEGQEVSQSWLKGTRIRHNDTSLAVVYLPEDMINKYHKYSDYCTERRVIVGRLLDAYISKKYENKE